MTVISIAIKKWTVSLWYPIIIFPLHKSNDNSDNESWRQELKVFSRKVFDLLSLFIYELTVETRQSFHYDKILLVTEKGN